MTGRPCFISDLAVLTQKMRDAVARGDALDMGTMGWISLTPEAFGYNQRFKKIAPEGHDWRKGPPGRKTGW